MTMQHLFSVYPPILVIHLKRFANFAKVTKYIEFWEMLTFSRESTAPSRTGSPSNAPAYSLTGGSIIAWFPFAG